MKITKDMTIEQVVKMNPEAAKVFMKHGMHCLGCAVSRYENIEQGAMAHGIDVKTLVEDLNGMPEDSN